MTGDEKSKCQRYQREFTPKNDVQVYGPTCARKLAGQIQLDSMALISGKVLRKGKEVDEPIYVKGEKGNSRR
jgi:hypothetical protein